MAKGLVAISSNTKGVKRVRNFRRYDKKTGITTVEQQDVFLFPRADDDRFLTEPVGFCVDNNGQPTGEIIIIQKLEDLPQNPTTE